MICNANVTHRQLTFHTNSILLAFQNRRGAIFISCISRLVVVGAAQTGRSLVSSLFTIYRLVRCGLGSLVNCDNSAPSDWSQWPGPGFRLVEAEYKPNTSVIMFSVTWDAVPCSGTQEKRSGEVLATGDPRCVQMSGEKCWSLGWWWLHVSWVGGPGHSSHPGRIRSREKLAFEISDLRQSEQNTKHASSFNK